MVLGFEKGDKAERFIMSMLSDYVCSLLLKDLSCIVRGLSENSLRDTELPESHRIVIELI